MAATVTYTFVNGGTTDGPQVSQNFTDLTTYINSNVILKDASVAFTAIPSGPASTPVSDNQFARKKYVDDVMAFSSASDTTTYGAWTSYNPTVKNNGRATVTRTVTYAKYNKVGKRVTANARVDITSVSAGSGLIYLELPVDIAAAAANTCIGTFICYDVFGGIAYQGSAISVSGTPSYVYGIPNNSAASAGFQFALTTADYVMYSLNYESAS